MAKKKGYGLKARAKSQESRQKTKKNEQKKNSKKSLSKRGTQKKGGGKEKDKRTGRGKSANVKRIVESKSRGVAPIKKNVDPSKGRIRDFRGQFIEAHYQDRLKKLKKELIDSGIFIDGKKVTRFTSYATITKAIYENKLFVLAESQNVSYFDVLGKIVSEVNALKEDQEIFVKVKPFFKDFRVFSIKHKEVKREDKIRSFYSQAVSLNPQLVSIIEHQSKLVQRVIDEFPRKINSPLFKIREKRFENPLTGYTYALEYDYNDIIPSGMDKSEFFDFLKAIMGDEYKQIAILRIKANLERFDENE